jgi:hypothetical protein
VRRLDAAVVVVTGGREGEANGGGGGGHRLEPWRRRRSGQRRKSRGGRGGEPSGGGPRGHRGGVRASVGKRRGLPARVREGGGASFYMDVTLGQLGQLGRWAVVPAHGLRRARRFRAVLGWHYGLRLQPSTSPTSCSCRPKPNNRARLVFVLGQNVMLWVGSWASCYMAIYTARPGPRTVARE